MKIALMHYHLKPGGVTTVIGQQVAALRRSCDVLVLTGEAPVGDLEADYALLPALAYDTVRKTDLNPLRVAGQIQDAIRTRWPGGCDLLHVHNPLLAKNRSLLEILRHLQADGLKLFLQIHDLAEDGRPNAFFDDPYPADCHYGVINSRDYAILLQAGLLKRGLHLLPNSVTPPAGPPSRQPRQPHGGVLYPIRAIRRKNVGEAILLSLFARPPTQLTVTLPPNSPADMQSYTDWKDHVRQNGLHVRFEAGLVDDYSRLVAEADYIITTSISEGFGFVFLEPWTASKPLWGRLLPAVCGDFMRQGIHLDHLYHRLAVPLSLFDHPAFQRQWCRAYSKAAACYGKTLPWSQIESRYSRIVADDSVDFGLLAEPFQREVIRAVQSDDHHRARMIDRNPHLDDFAGVTASRRCVMHNRRLVLAHYNQDAYRRRLLEIYSRVVNTPVHQKIDKPQVLDAFLTPEQFSLLKWSPYHG